MLLRREELASHVASHVGVPIAFAEYGVRVVLSAIGPYLAPENRALVAQELPGKLAAAIDHDVPRRPIDPHWLLPGMRPGQAHELIATVCRTLATRLSAGALTLLREALPPETARLFR